MGVKPISFCKVSDIANANANSVWIVPLIHIVLQICINTNVNANVNTNANANANANTNTNANTQCEWALTEF